jgi:hypothetical protein
MYSNPLDNELSGPHRASDSLHVHQGYDQSACV